MSDHVVPIRVYLLIFFALMALTAVTVAVAFIDLGALSTVVALAIAITKAGLVILYFMHVRYSSSLTGVFAGTGFIGLLVLIVLLMTDYLSRNWTPQFSGWS